jgi:hypothetical protein
MRSRHKWTEATETIHYDEEVSGIPGGYSIKRLDLVTDAMIRGKVEYVRQYLDDSAESNIFLHGVEAWDIHRPSNDDDADDDTDDDSDDLLPSGREACSDFRQDRSAFCCLRDVPTSA